MKKYIAALAALTLSSLSATAADLGARPYTKAPAPVMTYNWTGCYVGAGGGYGMTNNESYLTAAGVQTSTNLTQGARGYLGTVGVGCDYQFGNWVVGAFADAEWTNIRGNHTGQSPGSVGLSAFDRQTLNWDWNVGGRVGYLVTPSLLAYVTAGYTEAEFSGATYRTIANTPTGFGIPRTRQHGYFIGAGDEYQLNWFPGLFVKTEYRFSDYNALSVPVFATATGIPTGTLERTHNYVHSVRTELVYRFNWGGSRY